MPVIALINYDSGNLRSVSQSLVASGAEVRLVSDPEALEGADAMVLPGVGSFGDSAASLKSRGLWDPVRAWVAADRPFLGICLGYQLLFESGEESPGVPGFGIFPGKVVRFQDAGLKIPPMEWHTITPVTPGEDLWRGLPPEPYVFFVHSFYPAPADESLVSSFCEYGTRFAASIRKGRVRATQFHPEKSQETGLAILRNFVSSL